MRIICIHENDHNEPKNKEDRIYEDLITFAAMTNANPGIYDGLVWCAGMHEMNIGFSFAECFRWTLTGIYCLDDANTL